MEQPIIVIFKGQSQYDVMRYFADYIAAAFEQYGYPVKIIDFLENDAVNHLNATIQKQEIFFFFSFNGIGIDIAVQGKSLYDQLQVPLVTFFVDDPIYHIDRINHKAENVIFSFVDRNHMDFTTTQLSKKNTKVFIPHATNMDERQQVLPIRDRKVDIFLPGSYADPEVYRSQWKQCGPVISSLMDDIMEYAYSYWGIPLHQAFQKILSDKGMEYSNYGARLFYFLQLIDKYLRQRRRRDLVLSLKDFNLHLCGNGWGRIKNLPEAIRIDANMPYPSVIDKMGQSKLVVTVLPLFFNGSHERVFDAARMGAVPVTDSNQYLSENFTNGEDIIFFEGNKPDISEIMANALMNEDKLNSIATESRSKILKEHLWVHRAAKILETVIIHRNLNN